MFSISRRKESIRFCTNNLMVTPQLEHVEQASELGCCIIVLELCQFFCSLVLNWSCTAFTSTCMFSGEQRNNFLSIF